MNVLLDPSARPVIAHRGDSAHAPENTLESFAQAIAAGADALEFDLRLSADRIPVVMHDPQVDRTTDGTGEVSRMSFDSLRELDAGAKYTADRGTTFPFRGAGHRIPSLEEVIEAFPTTPLLIEIKDPLAGSGTRRMIEAHNAESRCVVDSMDKAALLGFQGSDVAVGAARDDVARLMAEVLAERRITPFEFSALCVPLSYYGLPLPVKRFARIAPAHDCRVHVWTINDPEVAKDLWLAGVNGIITDDPAVMLKTRAGLPDLVPL